VSDLSSKNPEISAATHEPFAVAVTDVPPCNKWPAALRPDLVAPELALINQHRATIRGAQQLVIDPRLQACAEWKSLDMAGCQYMDHDDHGAVERTVADRFAVYYPAAAGWGENIAYGFIDAASVEAAFLSDVPHKANIENVSWLACGLAAAEANGLIFWVQDYGSLPVGPVPPRPVIAGIAPAGGEVGATVQITGQNLGDPAFVTFTDNVQAMSFAAVNDGEIRAVVPAGATTGPIFVTSAAGFAMSQPFTVGSTPTPTPSSLLGKWRQNAAPHHVITVTAVQSAEVVYQNQHGQAGRMSVKKLEKNYTQQAA
jgi:uncharacterized protein YkwD